MRAEPAHRRGVQSGLISPSAAASALAVDAAARRRRLRERVSEARPTWRARRAPPRARASRPTRRRGRAPSPDTRRAARRPRAVRRRRHAPPEPRDDRGRTETAEGRTPPANRGNGAGTKGIVTCGTRGAGGNVVRVVTHAAPLAAAASFGASSPAARSPARVHPRSLATVAERRAPGRLDHGRDPAEHRELAERDARATSSPAPSTSARPKSWSAGAERRSRAETARGEDASPRRSRAKRPPGRAGPPHVTRRAASARERPTRGRHRARTEPNARRRRPRTTTTTLTTRTPRARYGRARVGRLPSELRRLPLILEVERFERREERRALPRSSRGATNTRRMIPPDGCVRSSSQRRSRRARVTARAWASTSTLALETTAPRPNGDARPRPPRGVGGPRVAVGHRFPRQRRTHRQARGVGQGGRCFFTRGVVSAFIAAAAAAAAGPPEVRPWAVVRALADAPEVEDLARRDAERNDAERVGRDRGGPGVVRESQRGTSFRGPFRGAGEAANGGGVGFIRAFLRRARNSRGRPRRRRRASSGRAPTVSSAAGRRGTGDTREAGA